MEITNPVITHIGAFLLGMPIGAILHRVIYVKMQGKKLKVDKIVAVLVASVWTTTVLWGSFIGQNVDVWIHTIMGSIVGYLFHEKRKNDK